MLLSKSSFKLNNLKPYISGSPKSHKFNIAPNPFPPILRTNNNSKNMLSTIFFKNIDTTPKELFVTLKHKYEYKNKEVHESWVKNINMNTKPDINRSVESSVSGTHTVMIGYDSWLSIDVVIGESKFVICTVSKFLIVCVRFYKTQTITMTILSDNSVLTLRF